MALRPVPTTTRPGSGINTLDDLKGKTISTNAQSDLPFLALKAILQANSIDISNMHVVVVHHPNTMQALATPSGRRGHPAGTVHDADGEEDRRSAEARSPEPRTDRMRKSVRGLIGLVGFVALWELTGRLRLLDPTLVPPPSAVATSIRGLFGQADFRADLVATVLAWLIATLLAVAIAVPAGLLLGSVPVLRTATSAVVEFLRPVPSVPLIPLVLVAFGEGAQTKIILATFASVWPILFNVVHGLQEVEPRFVDTARTYRTGRLRTALTVRLPYITSFVLTGIRLAAAICLVVTMSTEFLTDSGTGFGSYIVLNGEQTGDMSMVIGGVVLAGILGCFVNALLHRAHNRWFGWAEGGQ
jgi:NitT/TauT family transport system permease protein